MRVCVDRCSSLNMNALNCSVQHHIQWEWCHLYSFVYITHPLTGGGSGDMVQLHQSTQERQRAESEWQVKYYVTLDEAVIKMLASLTRTAITCNVGKSSCFLASRSVPQRRHINSSEVSEGVRPDRDGWAVSVKPSLIHTNLYPSCKKHNLVCKRPTWPGLISSHTKKDKNWMVRGPRILQKSVFISGTPEQTFLSFLLPDLSLNKQYAFCPTPQFSC